MGTVHYFLWHRNEAGSQYPDTPPWKMHGVPDDSRPYTTDDPEDISYHGHRNSIRKLQKVHTWYDLFSSDPDGLQKLPVFQECNDKIHRQSPSRPFLF